MTTNENNNKKKKNKTNLIIGFIMLVLCLAVAAKPLYEDVSKLVKAKQLEIKKEKEYEEEIAKKEEQGDKVIFLNEGFRDDQFEGTAYWIKLDRELEADPVCWMESKEDWEYIIRETNLPEGNYGTVVNPDTDWGFYSSGITVVDPTNFIKTKEKALEKGFYFYIIWDNADGTSKQETCYNEQFKPYNQWELDPDRWNEFFLNKDY